MSSGCLEGQKTQLAGGTSEDDGEIALSPYI